MLISASDACACTALILLVVIASRRNSFWHSLLCGELASRKAVTIFPVPLSVGHHACRYSFVCLSVVGMNVARFFVVCWLGLRGSESLHRSLLIKVNK